MDLDSRTGDYSATLDLYGLIIEFDKAHTLLGY